MRMRPGVAGDGGSITLDSDGAVVLGGDVLAQGSGGDPDGGGSGGDVIVSAAGSVQVNASLLLGGRTAGWRRRHGRRRGGNRPQLRGSHR
jgi:hypothetical protein